MKLTSQQMFELAKEYLLKGWKDLARAYENLAHSYWYSEMNKDRIG